MKIGVLCICTGKYDVFLQPLINDIDKNFFEGHEIEIYLFSDKEIQLTKSAGINIVRIPIEHKPFPYPTIKRYEFFTNASDKINCDYAFYIDVDMAICDKVGYEILPNNDEKLVAVLHPGFYNGGGSWGDDEKSLSYTHPKDRKKYYAGGFQGGKTEDYLLVCKLLAQNINEDEKNGVKAIHNDETHWNKYLSVREGFKVLDPSYCMVEEISKRRKWGINHFKPKIIALAKDHDAIRN